MDASISAADKSSKHRSALAAANRPSAVRRLSYGDGFRFGVGFLLAHLALGLMVGGLAWGLVVALHLH